MTIVIDYQQLFLTIGILAILVVLIWIVVRILKPRPASLDMQLVEQKSAEIKQLISSDSQTSYVMALIEADKLLDIMLKNRRIPGENMGQRMKYAARTYPEIRAAWYGHLLRNKVVHEHVAPLGKRDIQRAWKIYQSAYRALQRQ